ncbi:hypothetical protein Gohar_008415, partial [Gossypium harknessii]|nr:hypothetical protein [Gossypium harknessii]
MFHGPISVEEADVDSYLDIEESNMDLLVTATDGFDCIDFGYGFYAMKFVSDKDCLKRVEVKSTTMWIHLLGLPIEYFHELFLVSIGKFVGKPIK